MKIGLLVIATGKYISFVEQFRDSAEKYFFKNTPTQVTIFVFTDSSIVPNRTIKLYKEHKKFPYPTLTRYHTFYKYRKKLSQMDYLFYCDVDMRFVAPVGKEILSDLTATLHPGFFNKKRQDFSYERRKNSTAYVAPNEGKSYFCGGFNGGSAKTFLKMSRIITRNINEDLKNKIVAVWHDESHFNRYLVDHPPKLVLTPSYCYPEELSLPFTPKLLALHKNHEAMRFSGFELIVNKLFRWLISQIAWVRNKIGIIPHMFWAIQFWLMGDFPQFWLNSFYRQKLGNIYYFPKRGFKNNRQGIDLVTVAFNNLAVITSQIKFLKKNLQDEFCYTVADNSTNQAVRQEIEKICRNENVGYISLPPNPFSHPGLGSLSHGAALTWVYRNFLRRRSFRYFGFLDHDIFPYRRTSLIKYFQTSPVFGMKHSRGHYWYLWAGFCFFDKQFVGSRELNFISTRFGKERVDTGGANWSGLYKFVDDSKLPKFVHRYLNLTGGKIPQHDWVEFFGDWLHLFNASNWYEMDEIKREKREKLVTNLIKKYDAKK